MVYVVAGAADEPEDPDHSAKIILGEASVFSKQSAMHMSHSPDEAVLVMVRFPRCRCHTTRTPPALSLSLSLTVAAATAWPMRLSLRDCPDVAPAVLHAFLSLLMDHSALCSAHVRARAFGSGRVHHRRMHRTWCHRCRRLRCSRFIALTTTALARRIKSRRCPATASRRCVPRALFAGSHLCASMANE